MFVAKEVKIKFKFRILFVVIWSDTPIERQRDIQTQQTREVTLFLVLTAIERLYRPQFNVNIEFRDVFFDMFNV